MAAPHRVVDGIARGVADAVAGVANSVLGTATGAGEQVMSALDKPFKEVTGKIGPHRMIDAGLDGIADAARNAGSNGIVGSLKILGEGLMKALDNPVEQIGFPPKEIGSIRR